MNTRKITSMAVLAALSVVLVAIIHIPMPAPISFLEYDPADIPILISGFAFGPVAGLVVTAVASIIQGLTVSAQSGIYGIIMHVLATGVYTLVSALIYTHRKTKKTAGIAIACGTAAMVLTMFGANLVVTPYFMMGTVNADTTATVMALMPYILLFNLGKAALNGVITFLVYKRVSPILHKQSKRAEKAAESV